MGELILFSPKCCGHRIPNSKWHPNWKALIHMVEVSEFLPVFQFTPSSFVIKIIIVDFFFCINEMNNHIRTLRILLLLLLLLMCCIRTIFFSLHSPFRFRWADASQQILPFILPHASNHHLAYSQTSINKIIFFSWFTWVPSASAKFTFCSALSWMAMAMM